MQKCPLQDVERYAEYMQIVKDSDAPDVEKQHGEIMQEIIEANFNTYRGPEYNELTHDTVVSISLFIQDEMQTRNKNLTTIAEQELKDLVMSGIDILYDRELDGMSTNYIDVVFERNWHAPYKNNDTLCTMLEEIATEVWPGKLAYLVRDLYEEDQIISQEQLTRHQEYLIQEMLDDLEIEGPV